MLGTASDTWDDVDRIIAIGDVHGAYDQLESLLIAAGVIDTAKQWAGGDTHLVSLGDLLDRGPDSRKAMDLLMRLQTQAPASSGMVHVLLGNHELMNMTGDLRDVSEAEYTALANIGGHRAAFSAKGHYGRWLITLPFMIRINGTVFTHGGVPQLLAGMDIETINSRARHDLTTLLQEGSRLRNEGLLAPAGDLVLAALDADEALQPLLGETFLNAAKSTLLGARGPLWYRGTAACHALLETAALTSTLQALGAKRVVVGHTPTPDRELNSRMKGAAYIIDTGMLAKVYKGQPRALELIAGSARGIDATGATSPITQLPIADPVETLSHAAFEAADAEAGVRALKFDNGLNGRFVKLSQRASKRAIAAYRLDRRLGLHMVPATVQRSIDSAQGIVMAWPGRPFNEQLRSERALTRPNYCQRSSDFALLAAFDALQGKLDRTPQNLFYGRRNWQIRVTENHNAFGTSSRLPATAYQPTLPHALATALSELTTPALEELLADLLGKREIKALLKRRDTILTWPRA